MQESVFFQPQVGAEAKIELIDWHGTKAIRKLRIPKAYRDQSLDRRLRERRTKEEARILHEAKLARVNCPNLFFADPGNSEIVMEYIEGLHLFNTSLIQKKFGNILGWYEILGKYVGKLHSKNIIHGDLTTKNVIVTGDRLFLIDFGLSFISERGEDRGEDLHLLKQVLRSTNELSFSRRAFDSAIKGYASIVGEKRTKEVLSKVAEISRRGRYARVD
jgi:TP53 regulating kinase and related kinases